MRFATVEVGVNDEASDAICAVLGAPTGLPVPWMAAVWDGRRIPLNGAVGSLWRTRDGVLVGADILKNPGSLLLLCESLLSAEGIL